MLDRAWGGMIRRSREGRGPESRRPDRRGRRPHVESLEGRTLLSAALATLPNISVPSQEGYQVPLDASASGAPSATFTVSSTNPDIKATVAQGPFLTFTVSHTPASGNPSDPTINKGTITFQMFQDLTPTTTSLFESFVNAGYYTDKTIHRINDAFSGTASPTNVVIQGGSPNGDGTGSSGLPGTPYGLELSQQLAFTQAGTLAVANSGAPDTNDTQFFYDTGPQTGLNYMYTIFGQMVAGQDTTALLSQVATEENTALAEKSQPISPVIINSATLSNTAPYGVIHVDTTGATPGETSDITVTSHDPTTNTSVSQTFTVTVTANSTPPPSTFVFTPLASPVSKTIASNTPSATATPVQLEVTNNNTKATTPFTTSYKLVSQPAHGTLSNFNATTGTVDYTPDPGYFGTDVFTYEGALSGTYTDSNGTSQTLTDFTGNAAPVLINVTPQAAVNTGAVRVIGPVLEVTPLPTPKNSPANQILVTQTTNPESPANDTLTVSINGVTDTNQPLAQAINRIEVFGSKASNDITVDPSVDPTINVTLEGGHGGKNVIQAGAGPTLEQGWYGQNQLHGGTGKNQLLGAAGHVRFFATSTTTTIFAGKPNPGYTHFHSYKDKSRVTLNTPGGTFYKLLDNKLVPVPTPPAAKGLILQSSAKTAATGAATTPNATGSPSVTG
jgi:cyclophilin family peptidyl-prolyl cis-trans isomerase